MPRKGNVTEKQKSQLIPPQKGEVRNPKGRPKGARSLSTILKEMLETDVTIANKETGEKEKMPFQDAIIKRLITKAANGDIRAIQEIYDRMEGKAKQTIEQTEKGELTIIRKTL